MNKKVALGIIKVLLRLKENSIGAYYDSPRALKKWTQICNVKKRGHLV
jgi:hypothetical protein